MVNFGLAARIQEVPNRIDKFEVRDTALEIKMASLETVLGEDGLVGCTLANSMYVSINSLKNP
jgi:hypothetical protein